MQNNHFLDTFVKCFFYVSRFIMCEIVRISEILGWSVLINPLTAEAVTFSRKLVCWDGRWVTRWSPHIDEGSVFCLLYEAFWQTHLLHLPGVALCPGETGRPFCRGSRQKDVWGCIHIPVHETLGSVFWTSCTFHATESWVGKPAIFLLIPESSPEQALHILDDLNSSTSCSQNLLDKSFLIPE